MQLRPALGYMQSKIFASYFSFRLVLCLLCWLILYFILLDVAPGVGALQFILLHASFKRAFRYSSKYGLAIYKDEGQL